MQRNAQGKVEASTLSDACDVTQLSNFDLLERFAAICSVHARRHPNAKRYEGEILRRMIRTQLH